MKNFKKVLCFIGLLALSSEAVSAELVQYMSADKATAFQVEDSGMVMVTLPYVFFKKYEYFQKAGVSFSVPVKKDEQGNDYFSFVSIKFHAPDCKVRKVRDIKDLEANAGRAVMESDFSKLSLFSCHGIPMQKVQFIHSYMRAESNGYFNPELIVESVEVEMEFNHIQTSVVGSEEMMQIKNNDSGVVKTEQAIAATYSVEFDPKGISMFPIAYVRLVYPLKK